LSGSHKFSQSVEKFSRPIPAEQHIVTFRNVNSKDISNWMHFSIIRQLDKNIF
jgi:hypothetical protein